MNSRTHGPVIIGSGPSGMAAAVTLNSYGIRPLVIDDQEHWGGQIYRGVDHSTFPKGTIMGIDYWKGKESVTRAREADVEYWPNTTVWSIDRSLELAVLRRDRSLLLRASHIILATGAYERPVPVKGWTLPGVMGAGAGQILMKTSGLVPEESFGIAGKGPLIYLLALQYAKAGARPSFVLDYAHATDYRRALPQLPRALRAPSYLWKGASLLGSVRVMGIRRISGVREIECHGDGRLESVSYKRKGVAHTLPCSVLFLHQGVIPNLQLTRLLRCDHKWNELQQCWQPIVDENFQTSLEGVFAVGDGSGIVGVEAAKVAGQISALALMRGMGHIGNRDYRKATKHLKRVYRNRLIARTFIDTIYTPNASDLTPADDVIICRCEELLTKQVREAVGQGCVGPNQTKSFTRAGMGPCQGRMCGLAVAQTLATESHMPMQKQDYYRIRPPIKPITLDQLASVEDFENS